MSYQEEQEGLARRSKRRDDPPRLVLAIAMVMLAGAASLGIIDLLVQVGAVDAPAMIRLAGAHTLAIVLIGLPIAMLVCVRLNRSREASLSNRVDEVCNHVRMLTDQAVLSDDTRRVVNRRAERDLIGRAIEEDLRLRDYDAGLVLCDELAERFGARAEAEAFRARIQKERHSILESHIDESMGHIEGMILQRQWDSAFNEARKVQRLYPESVRVGRLPDQVLEAKAAYKADLERRFLDAAQRDDIECAMEVLKELDGYLAESEAAPYREVARGVIGKARENLGAQFKLAVHDHQWADAANVGRRIINEFPNTRMAHEVRGLLEGILMKANAERSFGGVATK